MKACCLRICTRHERSAAAAGQLSAEFQAVSFIHLRSIPEPTHCPRVWVVNPSLPNSTLLHGENFGSLPVSGQTLQDRPCPLHFVHVVSVLQLVLQVAEDCCWFRNQATRPSRWANPSPAMGLYSCSRSQPAVGSTELPWPSVHPPTAQASPIHRPRCLCTMVALHTHSACARGIPGAPCSVLAVPHRSA